MNRTPNTVNAKATLPSRMPFLLVIGASSFAAPVIVYAVLQDPLIALGLAVMELATFVFMTTRLGIANVVVHSYGHLAIEAGEDSQQLEGPYDLHGSTKIVNDRGTMTLVVEPAIGTPIALTAPVTSGADVPSGFHTDEVEPLLGTKKLKLRDKNDLVAIWRALRAANQ